MPATLRFLTTVYYLYYSIRVVTHPIVVGLLLLPLVVAGVVYLVVTILIPPAEPEDASHNDPAERPHLAQTRGFHNSPPRF